VTTGDENTPQFFPGIWQVRTPQMRVAAGGERGHGRRRPQDAGGRAGRGHERGDDVAPAVTVHVGDHGLRGDGARLAGDVEADQFGAGGGARDVDAAVGAAVDHLEPAVAVQIGDHRRAEGLEGRQRGRVAGLAHAHRALPGHAERRRDGGERPLDRGGLRWGRLHARPGQGQGSGGVGSERVVDRDRLSRRRRAGGPDRGEGGQDSSYSKTAHRKSLGATTTGL
jgi:hypothetical protein